jgi:lycopene cyclase domain-containing protein
MQSYPLLALSLVILVVLLDILFRTHIFREKRTWVIAGILLLFTLIFDSILTGLPIVTYTSSHLSGIYLGSIPLEDLSYTFVVIFLPRIILKRYEQR